MSQLLQIIWSGFAVSPPYVLLAMSFALVLKVMRIWNFAQPAAMAIAFYTMLWLSAVVGLPLYAAVVGGLAVTIAFNVALEKVGFRALRARSAPSMTYFIFTLVVTQLVAFILIMVFGTQGYTLGENIIPDVYNVGSLVVTSWEVRAIVTAAVSVALLYVFLHRTKWGTRLLAVSNHSWLAELYGIRVSRVHGVTMSAAALGVTLAMYLLGTRVAITPDFGLTLIVETVAAAIIGGIGNVWGAAVAAIGIRIVQGLSVIVFPSLWQGFIVYVILFVVILSFPQGIPALAAGLRRRVSVAR